MSLADAVAAELSPVQLRSIAEARAKLNIWEGAIRSGKTIASLLAWVIHVARMLAEPGEVIVFGRTRDSVGRNVFGPLQDSKLFGPIARHVQYTPGAPTARVFGQTVHVLGASDVKAEPKVRGLTAKSAYGDELTTLPADFFRQVVGRLSVDGAQLFGTTNPDNPAHWLRKEWLQRPGETALRSWHFTLDDNPHLPAWYVAQTKATYVGLWHRRFVLGEWVQAEGAVYDAFDPDRHVVDVMPPLAELLATGTDYGTRNPFSAVMLALTADRRLLLTRELRHDPRTARAQLTDPELSARFRGWLGPDRPRLHAVDPSARSYKLMLFRDGVRNVHDADNAVVDGIRRVAGLFATDRLQVHSSCAGLIDELPGYAWDDAAAAKGDDRPVKVDDHSVDAMRYAVSTAEPFWRTRIVDVPTVAPIAA